MEILFALLTVSAMLGMAVSANQLIKRQDGCKQKYLVAASTRIYQGTLVFENASGYAGAVTDAANSFAGVAIEEVDNSSGANGDLPVEVWTEGVFELAGSGFAQTDVGTKAYATDNYTVDNASASGGVYIGKIVEFVSTTKVRVKIDVINDAQ